MMSQEGEDNYGRMRKNAAGIFLERDLGAIVSKLDLESDEEYVYIRFLTRLYRISRKNAEAEWLDGDEWTVAGFGEAMTLYDLLADSKAGAKASGEYTQIKNLADTLTGAYYAGKGSVDAMAKDLDGKEEDLSKGCEALEGERFGRGDVSYRIPIFRDLCAVVSFWSSDEEFPPQLIVMVDMNMKDFLHYETIWYMEGHLMDMVMKDFR